MDKKWEQEASYSYYIALPIGEAIQVRDGLEDVIWEIAREEGVEDTLRKADFRVRASEPAIDAGVVITVVITYIASKALDKVTDKVMDKVIDNTGKALSTIWLNRILPKLRQRLGQSALVDEDETELGRHD